MSEHDLQTEEYREYVYADGTIYRIDAPVTLHIIQGMSGWSQRVIDANGVTHRPTPGWLGIRWKPKADAPAFAL